MEIDSISAALFEKIRARFEKVSVGGQDAKTTTDPAKARFFNFDFTDKDGNNFGNVTISLVNEQSLKIYFGKNLSSDLNEEQKKEWYDFLRDMRMFAKRNLLGFDTRDISRSNLSFKDLKQISTTEKPVSIDDTSVTESKLYEYLNSTQYTVCLFGQDGKLRENPTSYENMYDAVTYASEIPSVGAVVVRYNRETSAIKLARSDFNVNISPSQQKEMKIAALNYCKTQYGITESKLYGSTKTSYEKITPTTRLIIRHSGAVDETVQGARTRKIESVYIEDEEGQRFKSPFTHLGGTRALARHVAEGGQIGDDFGKHIVEIVQEMGKIRKFIQGSRNKTFEDTEANDMVNAAKTRYQTIHQLLGKLKNSRGYKFYKEGWKPSTTLQDDIDLEQLRSKFVQKDFDNRLEDALPHVYQAYHSLKEKPTLQLEIDTHPTLVDEFSESLDKITEGTWALPDSDLKVKKLQELMVDVLPAGIDGADATGILYDLIGNDELFDRIYDASRGSPEMDVRPIIYSWLESNMPDVFEKVKANMESGSVSEQPSEQETNESMAQEGEYHNIYYSVETDSPPYYIKPTESLKKAEEYLQKIRDKGKTDAKIYSISIINGRKIRTPVNSVSEVADIAESDHLVDIRKLAGLK